MFFTINTNVNLQALLKTDHCLQNCHICQDHLKYVSNLKYSLVERISEPSYYKSIFLSFLMLNIT